MTAVGIERSTSTYPAWTASTLAILGDSTSVGLGDPLPGGGWRGVGPLLAAALGARAHNLANTGARLADVRRTQLPDALATRPEAAVVIVGMNDTLRSDFDPEGMRVDLTHVVRALHESGAVVLLVRYHDHARVFRMPASLRRALRDRIQRLNEMIDHVVAATGAPCLDLDELPGAYETSAWSVDRLHPSELGHRLLANGFADLLAARGCVVRVPVSMVCEGGRQAGPLAHFAWLVVKGIPWLWRRGRDLVPYALGIMLRDRFADRGLVNPRLVDPRFPEGCGQLPAEVAPRP
ncbi:SGNH/GDSL hydrolase family protein [Actinokineospora sp. NBRC 105648]|uniref:SGNH/GDSL hydrolase family protein n=1 Tax=Actinokineospora sp. NBRC 105648 TaxID=3032206 RepID=UPI0024A4A632|nr:SGNH/GDSL hydrolase family protein [Actinokineospora sp. NBRC 105648]GLZ41424.1 SGNH hydrolase [Actinokineospora sp. NBRC 105648]